MSVQHGRPLRRWGWAGCVPLCLTACEVVVAPGDAGPAPGDAASGVGPVAPPLADAGGTGAPPPPPLPFDAGPTLGDAASGAPDPGPVPTPDGGSARPKRDPGAGPWEEGSAEACGLELSALADAAIEHYGIFRYGLRCHVKGDDGPTKMYSATKTLGGVAVGRVAKLTRGLARTGPGTGPLLHTDHAVDWLGQVSYNREATLAHVLAMCAQSADLSRPQFLYDGLGTVQINSLIDVSTRALQQLPEFRSTTFAAFVEGEVFARLGMGGSRFLDLGLATGWEATLSDMAKLGTLIMHGGEYGGAQLLDADWVYRMTHPAFEAANPAYGQLVWLNSRGNAQGGGGDLTTGQKKHEDPCAPAALWPSYPHPPSTAVDCRPAAGRSCRQDFDVGVSSAEGLNGQFIVMHPGLDLVIVAQNFSSRDGVRALWDAVRPALVARDPRYRGDEAAFCAAYGANAYAPDL